jgi:hypothetical protein
MIVHYSPKTRAFPRRSFAHRTSTRASDFGSIGSGIARAIGCLLRN